MLSPDTKKNITILWDNVSSAGLAPSPHIALEQISCLIYIKYLQQLASLHAEDEALRTSYMFSDGSYDVLIQASSIWKQLKRFKDIGLFLEKSAFPWLRALGSHQSFGPKLNGVFDDVYFQLDPTKHLALDNLISHIQKLFSNQAKGETDLPGEILDELYFQASINSISGQLATSPYIARFMVSLLDPSPGQSVIDPAVGTGTLLVSALEYMREQPPRNDRFQLRNGNLLVGIDLDHAQSRIAWVNLLLRGSESHVCAQGNSLAAQPSDGVVGKILQTRYDFVLSDIPFGGRTDSPWDSKLNERSRGDSPAGTNRVELQFIYEALRLLKPGGHAGIIIPQSVLSGSDEAHINIRRDLLVHHHIDAVILLPGKMHTPFGGISAALLVVRKGSTRGSDSKTQSQAPKTSAVWFYEVSDDAVPVVPRKKSTPKTDNDFLDALVHFKHRKMDMSLWEFNKNKYFQLHDLIKPATKFINVNASVSREATEIKQWEIPVRTWRHAENSHDDFGYINPEYVEKMQSRLYISGKLDTTLLDEKCIEARDWSLDLSRYKPMDRPKLENEQSISKLISDLELIEMDILERLRALRDQIGLIK